LASLPTALPSLALDLTVTTAVSEGSSNDSDEDGSGKY